MAGSRAPDQVSGVGGDLVPPPPPDSGSDPVTRCGLGAAPRRDKVG